VDPSALTNWPRLLDLAGCLRDTIDQLGLPEPCFTAVLPGAEVAMDYCGPCGADDDKCGMAWVRLVEAFPSLNFPNQDTSLSACSAPLAYTVELGIARCIPVGDDAGNPPDWTELMAAAQLQVADGRAMRMSLACCYGQKGWVLGTYRSWGPQGGCVWGTWEAWVPE
jgi:hypothetical protein